MNSYIEEFVNENASNDNAYNAKKTKSAIHQLKSLIKSLLRRSSTSTYKKQPQPEYFANEIDDNIANELLENEIFEDVDGCETATGVEVYHNGRMHVMPVFRGQRYVPVHFARTDAGTFFWSSMVGADADVSSCGDRSAICGRQTAEEQVATDRWAQA